MRSGPFIIGLAILTCFSCAGDKREPVTLSAYVLGLERALLTVKACNRRSRIQPSVAVKENLDIELEVTVEQETGRGREASIGTPPLPYIPVITLKHTSSQKETESNDHKVTLRVTPIWIDPGTITVEGNENKTLLNNKEVAFGYFVKVGDNNFLHVKKGHLLDDKDAEREWIHTSEIKKHNLETQQWNC